LIRLLWIRDGTPTQIKRRNKQIDALLERLREFVRLDYITAAEVARQIGVRDTTIYDWVLGQARPAEMKRIAAFLDSLPREKGSGGFILYPVEVDESG
jgi:hypothetical protein